jgi:predicted methyltransferase
MKKSLLMTVFWIAGAGSMVGCEKTAENAASVVAGNRVAEQEGANMHGEHGHHHHGGFDDPRKFEARWNDPGRDGWQHPEEIVAALALKPGATVADIGAGTGYMVAHLSRAVGDGGSVIALDVEQAMIAYLAERSGELGPARIIPRKVGPESPDLQADSVDGVVTLNTWHHIGGREAYARKVYAGLRRGGRFVVVDSEVDAESGPPKEMRVAAGRVVKELEAGGFRAELAHESMPEHYMVVGYKE